MIYCVHIQLFMKICCPLVKWITAREENPPHHKFAVTAADPSKNVCLEVFITCAFAAGFECPIHRPVTLKSYLGDEYKVR